MPVETCLGREDRTTPAARLKSSMRVLHVVPRLFGRAHGVVGGAERYALELARHMAEQVPTSLVCFGDEEELHQIQGRLAIHVLKKPWCVRGQRDNPVALRLLKYVQKADVVHCHQQHILASSLSAAACRLSGRKVFVSDLGGGGWDISGYISTDRWYHGHLHISEYSRGIFGHVDKSWAHVIYGGVDIAKFSPDDSTARDGPVLFVGRLLPHKAVDDLIKALPRDMKLEIIGTAYDANYERVLHQLAEGKDVVFRERCGDEDLIAAYRRALCVVLPSVYRPAYGSETNVPELLGQTLLEGMACGTPAICTQVASMPEVVRNNVTGFVVPPNQPAALCEKLLWLRDHPNERRIMGKAARQHVLEWFTWPKVVRRCLEIYAS